MICSALRNNCVSITTPEAASGRVITASCAGSGREGAAGMRSTLIVAADTSVTRARAPGAGSFADSEQPPASGARAGVVGSRRARRPGPGKAGITVEIRIGITNSGRELNFESSESADVLKKSISTALDADATHLTFNDIKGDSYIVPTAGLAYIELGTEEARRVGFVA